MANLNKVYLMGKLARDPELRHTPKGTALCEISLAISRTVDAGEGEKKEQLSYVDCTLWGRLAETAGKYLTKGRAVLVEGRLKFDAWDDKQSGQRRSRLQVVGESVQFLGSREEGGGRPPKLYSSQGQYVGPASKPPAASKAPREEDIDPSDIPF